MRLLTGIIVFVFAFGGVALGPIPMAFADHHETQEMSDEGEEAMKEGQPGDKMKKHKKRKKMKRKVRRRVRQGQSEKRQKVRKEVRQNMRAKQKGMKDAVSEEATAEAAE